MMAVDKKTVKGLIKEYNQKYFDGVLPTCEASVRPIKGYAGSYSKRVGGKDVHYTINISSNIDWDEEKLRWIIIHEMIHHYVNVIYRSPLIDILTPHGFFGHGYHFRKQCRRIERQFNIDMPIFRTDVYDRKEKIPSSYFGKMMRFLRMFFTN